MGPCADPRRLRRTAASAVVLLALGGGPAAAGLRSEPLAGLRTAIAALIMQGVEGGPLPLAVTARPEAATPSREGRFEVPLVLEVPGAALLAAVRASDEEAAPPERLELELYVYALDPSGAVVAHRAEALDLPLAEVGERLFEAGLRYRDALDLPAGSFALRFLLFAPANRTFGLAIAPVVVEPTTAPALSAPRFAGGCATWLEADSLAGATAAGADVATTPARAVLRAGTTAAGRVVLMGAAIPATADWALLARLRPKPAGDDEPTEIRARSLVPTSVRSGSELRFDLEIPPTLPQGRYELVLGTRAPGETAEAFSAGVEVWVIGPDAARGGADCSPAWGEVFRLAIAGTGSEPDRASGAATVESGPPSGSAEAKLRERYLAVLRGLTEGESLIRAAERLGEVEEDFLSSRADTFARLRAVETAVARDLATTDRHSLPVLLMLHQEVYSTHFERRRFGLATHSRELVMDLIDGLAAGEGLEDTQPLAAGILTLLADQAERHQVSGASRSMLERAVELDPGQAAARILLATSYERLGHTAQAGREFEELLQANAGSLEALLRLAVLLAREERWADSERLLRRTLAAGVVGWRQAVVYQTLARVLLSQERFDEAVEVLGAGRAAMPDDQRLAILEAYALDRAGRPAEAARVITDLPRAVAGGSPRLRYGQPFEGELKPLRQLLAQSLSVRLPALGRALAAEASGP